MPAKGYGQPGQNDTAISDFDMLLGGALSPRAYINTHVGVFNVGGAFTTRNDLTVLNRDNDGAEGRDPGHLALLHDLLVYNEGTGQWSTCDNSGWRYSTQYHYYMELGLGWGNGGPPCGENRHYYLSGWAAHHEDGAWYLGSFGSGVMYAYSTQQFAAATAEAQTEGGASVQPPVPEPPTKDFLDNRKPPKPDKVRDEKEAKDKGHSIYDGVSHDQRAS